MFAQVVKSGYFQLRQTPGVPLSQDHGMRGPGLGTCGLVQRGRPGMSLDQTRRFQLALQTQKAEKLVKPKGLVQLTVRLGHG